MNSRCWRFWPVIGLAAACWLSADETRAGSAPPVTLLPQDRVLVLAPHPDDEVIGCAGVIQRAVAMSLPLRVVFLTYGDAAVIDSDERRTDFHCKVHHLADFQCVGF